MIDEDATAENAFLGGGGELGSLMRAHRWADTALGDPAHWPLSLKTVVRIMLTSSQPIWIGWGPELLYLYNDAYKRIIGGKHPWALGRPTSEVWNEIWADIRPLLDSAMNGDGTFVESQLLIMERNGYPEETYYTFSYSPIPGDDGRPAGIICANSDETRRVIGERQLALLREIATRSAQAKSVDGAVACCLEAIRTDSHDLLFAKVFLKPRGQSAMVAMGEADEGLALPGIDLQAAPWQAAVADGALPRLMNLPADVAWPRGAWKVPARRAMVLPIAPSGEADREGLLVVGLNPFRLPEGPYLDFLLLVAQQVSSAIANAQAYERQRLRAEELAELDRTKTLFFSNVSHEFRTPLTLMLGPLADLLASPELPGPQRERLELIDRNARRLSKLVNTLLEFSRIEAGRHQSHFRPVDLAQFTADIASVFRSAMERAGLAYEVECETLPEPVWLDLEQWEQVVVNLLSNALKYTLAGKVSVRLRTSAGAAVLEVQDTGVGVPAEEVGRMFERFYRVQGTPGRTHEGSGIGLALVRELVRLHGGEVSADSTPGQGTTFTVRLPFGKAHLDPDSLVSAAPAARPALRGAEVHSQDAMRWMPAGEDAPAPESSEANTALLGERYRSTWGARVLVADDNADMRRYLQRLLAPWFDVETAADGEQALEAARRRPPALLLSDVMMPRLDGFGLLAAMRADPALHTVPVILLSARAGEEARVEGLRAGADDYLVKPFSSRELAVRVAAVIELDRERRSGEEKLKIFLAKASMFTWDIDIATQRVSLSDNAATMLGASPPNLERALSGVHPEDEPRHRRLVEHTIATQGQYTDEIRIVRPDDGKVRWMEVRGRVVSDASGQPTRLSGISFDITERKTMEQALREQDRRKDEFLAMLAHELRNPMAPIRNAVELMQLTAQGDDRMRRAVGIVDRQVQQLNRLVDDLLDVSRITRGRIELDCRPVDLSVVLAAAVEAAEPAIRERRHELSVHSGLPMTVLGDAARLQQCLVNLLTNATKYTDPGGRIDITMQQDQSTAVIRVSDNGTGIPPDLLPHVFELFVQSDRTLDRALGGLGIGLSVVRRLVDMHGGTVDARSDGIGHGATFEIRLPLASTTFPAADEGARQPAPRRRVLVVDDNRDAAESVAMVLQAEGHEVRVAFGADEALAVAPTWRPGVVLLDIGLPRMDGYEVARRLRALPALQGCCLVALTGYGQPSDRKRALEAGFDHHLVKPAPFEQIDRILRGS